MNSWVKQEKELQNRCLNHSAKLLVIRGTTFNFLAETFRKFRKKVTIETLSKKGL
jgi:hypothetical protein